VEKLPDLFGDERKKEQAQQAEHERKLQMLYAEIGKLTTHLNWLKKNLASSLPRSQRQSMLERDTREISLAEQTELLGVSRSSLYYEPVGPSEKEISLIPNTKCTRTCFAG